MKKVFYFSKQYGNPKTRLQKLGSIINFDVLKTLHLNYSRVGFSPPK
jgi:hypothetical protein